MLSNRINMSHFLCIIVSVLYYLLFEVFIYIIDQILYTCVLLLIDTYFFKSYNSYYQYIKLLYLNIFFIYIQIIFIPVYQ